MRFEDYMNTRKHGSGGITLAEALIIGISYPPKSGWKKRHADLQISDEAVQLLRMSEYVREETDKACKKTADRYSESKKLLAAGVIGHAEHASVKRAKKRAAKLVVKAKTMARNVERVGAAGQSEKVVSTPVASGAIKTPRQIKKETYSYDGFYESREWRELRYKALVKNGAVCQCCGATRASGAIIHVDHIKPRSKFPELMLSLDNLQTLCEACNMGKSNKDATDWR